MINPFEQALKFTLKWENGIANRPRQVDTGGLTNRGVTNETYNHYRNSINKPEQSVLFMSDKELMDIYKTMYWDKIYTEAMPERIAIAAFDFAVNSGPIRAVKYLQKILGVNGDGRIGPHTEQALENCDEPATLKSYLNWREMFFRKQPNFGSNPGWLNRLNDLRIYLGVPK